MIDNISNEEIEKFSKLANYWWDENGPLKTLHAINPTRLEWISHWQPNLSSITGLDIGCGGGILTEGLAKMGATMTGLEPAVDVCQVAKNHAKKASLDINYIPSTIEDFEPKSNFDAIYCLEMLEHVPDFNAIIYHARRLIKKDGLIFLSTINRTLKAYLGAIVVAEYALKLLERQTHDYQKFIKPSELCQSLRQNDFELIEIKGLSYNPLNQSQHLSDDLSINYLVAARAI